MPIPNPVDKLAFENTYFSAEIKQIYNTIYSGNAFKNPLNVPLTGFNTYSTAALADLEDMSLSPPGSFTTPDIESFIEKTQTLQESHTEFVSHTNRLSGVDLSHTENATPPLSTLLSVGQSSVALEHTLNEVVGNPCGKLLNTFGSLFLGADLYNQINTYYQEIIGLINNAEATVSQIEGQIEAFQNSIDSLIENDRLYFNNLISDLSRAALAQMLPGIFEDACGRYIIDKTIGKTELTQLF